MGHHCWRSLSRIAANAHPIHGDRTQRHSNSNLYKNDSLMIPPFEHLVSWVSHMISGVIDKRRSYRFNMNSGRLPPKDTPPIEHNVQMATDGVGQSPLYKPMYFGYEKIFRSQWMFRSCHC